MSGILKGQNNELSINYKTQKEGTKMQEWYETIEWTSPNVSNGTFDSGMYNETQRIPGSPKYTCYVGGEVVSLPDMLVGFADTACTRTVAGHETIKKYLEELKRKGKKYEKMATNADFTFGDGVKKNAAYAVQLPVSMYGKSITIHVEVIADSKLPLLLSLGTMRALGFKLDLENMVCIS